MKKLIIFLLLASHSAPASQSYEEFNESLQRDEANRELRQIQQQQEDYNRQMLNYQRQQEFELQQQNQQMRTNQMLNQSRPTNCQTTCVQVTGTCYTNCY